MDVQIRTSAGVVVDSFGSAAAPKATYSASIIGLASAALATDIFSITGSATKTICIRSIRISAVQTTASQVNVVVLKRSTANTAGTSTAPTKVAHDSTSIAATATVLAYTANPTVGALVGNIRAARMFVPGAATASDAAGLDIAIGVNEESQPVTLRGIAEVMSVNLNGVTVAAGSFNVAIEWTEA